MWSNNPKLKRKLIRNIIWLSTTQGVRHVRALGLDAPARPLRRRGHFHGGVQGWRAYFWTSEPPPHYHSIIGYISVLNATYNHSIFMVAMYSLVLANAEVWTQEAPEECRAAAVQAGEEPGGRAHIRQDGDVHVAGVPHAEGDVPQGQVHLQHEGVQVDGRVHDAARQVPARPRHSHRTEV